MDNFAGGLMCHINMHKIVLKLLAFLGSNKGFGFSKLLFRTVAAIT